MVSHPVYSSVSYQLAHQVIRRYETSRIRAHVCLLLGPPALVVAHISSSQARPAFALFTTFLSALASYLAALATSIIIYRLSPFHRLPSTPVPSGAGSPCQGPSLWRLQVTATERSQTCTGSTEMSSEPVCSVRAFGVPPALRVADADLDELSGPNELSIADASFVGPILGVSGLPKGPSTSSGPGAGISCEL